MPITAKLTQGKGCSIDETAYIGFREHGGEIILGNRVRILPQVMLRTCTGVIRIGNSSSVGAFTIMHALGGITIGNNVLISPRVQIFAQNHGIARKQLIATQKQTGEGITIEDDCWIGAGAIICDGVHLAKGTVIGAGSVVTHSTNEYEIWGGIPAKCIGERE